MKNMPTASITSMTTTVKAESMGTTVNMGMATDITVGMDIMGIMGKKVKDATGITSVSPDTTGMAIMTNRRLKTQPMTQARMKAMKDDCAVDSRHPHGHHRKHDFPNDGSLSSLFHQCMYIVHHADGRHSGQGRVLRILADEGELTQREMQERLKIQAGSLSELVAKLEAKGMLLRERDEADKRKVSLKITPVGLESVNPIPNEAEAQDPFAVLTSEEQDVLRSLLTKLLENNAK